MAAVQRFQRLCGHSVTEASSHHHDSMRPAFAGSAHGARPDHPTMHSLRIRAEGDRSLRAQPA
eukprot:6879955-Prymnesium_polylepis.2